MTRPASERLLALMLAASMAGPAAAARGDADQPIHIEADQVALDERERVTTYSGDVVMTQGSIEVRAARLAIHLTETDEIRLMVMTGSPATFRQLDDQGQEVYGEAARMRYEQDRDLVVLQERAVLKRGNSLFRGEHLELDVRSDTIRAGTEDAPGTGRVHITIEPSRPGSASGDAPGTGDAAGTTPDE